MTAPTPEPLPVSPLIPLSPAAPSQVRHPWRATARTAVALLVALLPVVPEVLGGLHLDTTALGAQTLAVAAGITRVMALPAVNDLLTRLGLGAEPKV
jgi:hypothetical protein